MVHATHGADTPWAAQSANKFYLIAWRWHFYAGLYVIPFPIRSATTGPVMLWISWGAGIDGERIAVNPQGQQLPISVLVAAAEVGVPGGSASQYVARALSEDLRSRVLKASNEGLSARQAAARFGIGVSSAIRWIAGATLGELKPRPQGRGRAFRLDEHEVSLLR
jgi:uncharacterized iron-regulated membrane protein